MTQEKAIQEARNEETLCAKLRNALSPHYGLPSIILRLKDKQELFYIAEQQAEQALKNNLLIDELLVAIEDKFSASSGEKGDKKFSLGEVVKCLDGQYITNGENRRYNEAVRVCIAAVQSLSPKEHSEGELKCQMCGIENNTVKDMGYKLCPKCNKELGESIEEVEKHRNRNEEFDGGGGA